MSKIAENKALEAYPEHGGKRECYIKGYDQAMQNCVDKLMSFVERQSLGCIDRKYIEYILNN